jgi:hypothetical protein
MKPLLRTLSLSAVAVLAGGLLAACGGSSNASGGSPDLSITSPANGATVGSNVAVSWDTSEQLGPPETGRDHVHVFVDGHSNDYTVVGGNSFTVKGLTPGKHTIDVTLQHADHSSAGAEDKVDVTVSPSGTAPSSPATSQPTQSSGGGSGYGY